MSMFAWGLIVVAVLLDVRETQFKRANLSISGSSEIIKIVKNLMPAYNYGINQAVGIVEIPLF